MRLPRNAKIFRGQWDVIPFAGVFFLLVLFLLLNSYLVFPPGVEIELPRASGLPGVGNPKMMVAMDADGQLYLENQVIDRAGLRDRLQRAVAESRDPLTLVLLADRHVPHAKIVELGAMARETGLAKVVLAARPARLRAEGEQ